MATAGRGAGRGSAGRGTAGGATAALAELGRFRDNVAAEVGRAVVGQEEILHLLLASLLANGHSLLVGVPGLAKTLLVSSLARVLDVSFNRIQFTPDLMPSDITGSEVIEEAGRAKRFRFVPGPVFANVLLADEINRTPPKTQAALLQAMQEREVTVSGQTYTLEAPFFVLATQNPIEQEGTYPLPEAQLDRFLFCIRVPYPDEAEEIRIVAGSSTRAGSADLKPVVSRRELLGLQRFVNERFPMADTVTEAAVRLVRATRPEESPSKLVRKYVAWGAGPRSGAGLALAARASAALHGKKAADLDDIRRVAHPVLRHRVLTNFQAEADGVSPEDVVDELLGSLRA